MFRPALPPRESRDSHKENNFGGFYPPGPDVINPWKRTEEESWHGYDAHHDCNSR